MKLRELLSEIHHDYRNLNYDTKTSPLKAGDTITVFHGYNDYNNAILTAKHGLSGAEKANRVYSYEFDNNPKGLFVTPNFKVASQFISGYKIAVIIEFDAHLSELEAPAWPTGGWVGYGGYSQNWGWGAQGRAARRQAQKKLSAQHKDDPQNPESVRLSDDPYLANMMLSSGESQALYIGHLNPTRIKAFHVKEFDSNRVPTSDWNTLSRDEFLSKYEELLDPKKSKKSFKMFNPDDEFDPEVFLNKMSAEMKISNVYETLIRIAKYVFTDQHKMTQFQQYLGNYLWPKQIPAAFNWLKREYKKSLTST